MYSEEYEHEDKINSFLNKDTLRQEEFLNDRTTKIEKLLYDKDEVDQEIKNIDLFVQQLKQMPIKSAIAREQTDKFLTTLNQEQLNLNEIADEIEQSILFVRGY